jgi:hypothetical protein
MFWQNVHKIIQNNNDLLNLINFIIYIKISKDYNNEVYNYSFTYYKLVFTFSIKKADNKDNEKFI